MSRNLLSEISSLKVFSSVGVFANGDTMTILVYKDGSSTPETLTAGTLTEIGSLGIFWWPFSDLATAPTALAQYYWTMQDATTKTESGIETFGGYPELLLSVPQALTPADTCRITTSLFEANGECVINPKVFSDPTIQNDMELKTQYHDGSRYFQVDTFKPSYDSLTGVAYWVLPQGSTVDVTLKSFNIVKTGAVIPSVSTVDLKTWLDSL